MGARKTATIVTWQEEFSVGLPEIDEQHKVLFDIINRLWGATIAKAPQDEMLDIVRELEKYTLSHFTAEEAFMRVSRFPGFEEHRKAHKTFIDRLSRERLNVVSGGHLSLDLLRFLKDWLINHILVDDKKYAASYKRDNDSPMALGKFFKRFWR